MIWLALLSLASASVCPSEDKDYKTGDKIVLCVYVDEMNFTDTNATASTSHGHFIAFTSRVDVYSAVKLNYSYSGIYNDNCGNASISNDTNDVSVFINCSMSYGIFLAFGDSITTPYAPYLKDILVAKVFSAVVTLESGKVKKIQWDNYCDICSEECIDFNGEEVCAEKECSYDKIEDCDPRVYVSWIGTDSDGNNLLSSTYRISQFRKYSIFSMYKQARSNF